LTRPGFWVLCAFVALVGDKWLLEYGDVKALVCLGTAAVLMEVRRG
jgi:hypothetical protein